MRRDQLWPSLAVAFSGAMWGLYWIAARWLGGEGINGLWQSLILFALALIPLLVLLPSQRHTLQAAGSGLLLTGLFMGAAFTLYTASLLLTDVVRALLLFYITPVWSTLLTYLLRNERPTPLRLLALVLGLGGLLVVLDYSSGLPLPRNIGDWLALAGGMSFAYGSVRSYASPAKHLYGSVVAFNLGGLVSALVLVALPVEALGTAPAVGIVAGLFWPLLLLAVGLFLPTTFLIMWGTLRVDPARVGILLMMEIVVGVATAAAFSGEPFGLREAAGAALILGAGVVDVAGGRSSAKS